MTQVADSVWGACTDRKIRVWNIAVSDAFRVSKYLQSYRPGNAPKRLKSEIRAA